MPEVKDKNIIPKDANVRRLYDIHILLKSGEKHTFEERNEWIRNDIIKQFEDKDATSIRINGLFSKHDPKSNENIKGTTTWFFNKQTIATLQIKFFTAWVVDDKNEKI